MRKLKGISYDDPKDKKLIDYMDSHGNASAYVLGLVKRDMEGKGKSDLLAEEVKRLMHSLEEKLMPEFQKNNPR